VCAFSGHVPNALSLLMRARQSVACAVLCYGYMLDLEGSTSVADAAAMFRFVNPCAGRSVADLPVDTPLFIARAGHDETPRLNEALDRFVTAALAHNLPITLANHAAGPHAFDIIQDSAASRQIITQILAFLRNNLDA
jgi:acetyl esterase/lipase